MPYRFALPFCSTAATDEYARTPCERIRQDIAIRFQSLVVMFSMSYRSHLRSLLVMAMADGTLEDAELEFLTQRCHELNLDESQLREAILFAMDDDAAVHLPGSSAEQETLLKDLMQMMTADQMLDEREKRLFALVAAKLGFDRQRLAKLLDLNPNA